jgi:hypothetical protein
MKDKCVFFKQCKMDEFEKSANTILSSSDKLVALAVPSLLLLRK